MLKKVIILFTLLMFCYCASNGDVYNVEARAKKKKGSLKLLGLLAVLAIAKIALFKTASIFFMMTVFQKLFYFGGLVVKYFLRNKKPAAVYGAPASYDTVGYSYGPPENQHYSHEGYPGESDIASSIDWLVNKNV